MNQRPQELQLEAFQPHEQAVILRASGRLLDRLETKDGRRG